MSSTAYTATGTTHSTTTSMTPARQAFRALQLGFTVAPILAGADKFLNLLTNWEQYLSPTITSLLPFEAGTFLAIVGVIEIAAGILVAMRPRLGGMIVAAWLVAIIINLLMIPGYFDVALRDLGLAIGAFAMARLAMTESSK